MSLLDTFAAIASSVIPFLKEAKEALDPVFKTSDEDEGFINIKAGVSAAIKSQKDGKSINFKPPPTPRASPLGVKQISFRDRQEGDRGNLPGLSNPYVRSLYEFYDINKIRKLNTILKDSDIEVIKPIPPKAATIKVGG